MRPGKTRGVCLPGLMLGGRSIEGTVAAQHLQNQIRTICNFCNSHRVEREAIDRWPLELGRQILELIGLSLVAAIGCLLSLADDAAFLAALFAVGSGIAGVAAARRWRKYPS